MSLTLKKKVTNFRIRIRSRHPSHRILRTALPLLPFRCVFRLGSLTKVDGVVSEGGKIVEINTIEGIKNSANKRLMKECFEVAGVNTAEWFFWDNNNDFVRGNDNTVKIKYGDLPYPVVLKNIYGSRGTGNYLVNTEAELTRLIADKKLINYIVEKFHNYNREYRLHITQDGCFYTCRKMLRKDTPEKDRWHRHENNSNWILEENELFDKPSNWDKIVSQCVNALNAVELDVCSFDIRVQSAKTQKDKVRENPEFIILECNSASSFGEITAQRYLAEIPKLAMRKAKEYGIIN